MKRMVLFSGGVDSTALLLQELESGSDVLVVHLILKTETNRWQLEMVACARVIAELHARGYDFEYMDVTVDATAMGGGRDSWYYIQTAANIARNREDIIAVAVGFIDDEAEAIAFPQTINNTELFRGCKGTSCAELTYPLAGKTKKELIAKMGNLFECTFSCRVPVGIEPCGQCNTCKAIKEAL